MCGRYTVVDVKAIYSRFGVKEKVEELTPRFNAAPGNMLPVIVKEAQNIAKLMRWGLIPAWAKDPKIGYRMINARMETLLDKPSYRRPLATKRCLVPANGFYEWERQRGGKQPYYFKPKDGNLMAFAGLFDIWKDVEDVAIWSYTIITKGADNVVSKVHNRMPVILHPEMEAAWLDPLMKPQDLLDILQQSNISLSAYPVSNAVNKAENESQDLIYPINST